MTIKNTEKNILNESPNNIVCTIHTRTHNDILSNNEIFFFLKKLN